MTISIITINYNNLTGLKKTFESIIRQTFSDYEWIVIDGGSTDGSKEFIEQHKDLFAFWCSEPDKGIYNALNKGLEHCSGEYVSCMNAGDCFYEPTTLTKIFSKERKEDVLYGDVLFVNSENGDKRIKTFPKKLTLSWMYHDTLNHQATFVKRDTIRKYGFDEKYKIMADRKLWLQLLFSRCSFLYLNQPIARFDKTGVSSQDGERWIKELKQVRSEIYPPILNKYRVIRKLFSYLWSIGF